MFTLGQKQRIINKAADVVVSDASGAARGTTAAVVHSTDSLDIAGFGSFPFTSITDIKFHRGVAAAREIAEHVCVVPAGTVAGNAIEVIITLNTGRYQAEVLAQNFIGNGRSIKFSTAAFESAPDADAVRTAVVNAWGSYKDLFAIGTPFLEIANGTASTDIKTTINPGFESITVEKVELKRVVQFAATQNPVKLTSTVSTAGSEGKGTGKFLEESIRMATCYNTDPYGVDTDGAAADIRGLYSALTFTVGGTRDEKLGIAFADQNANAFSTSFTVFLNEGSTGMLGSDGQIEKIAQAIVELAGDATIAPNVVAGAVTLTSTPDNFVAINKAQSLVVVNGNSVATAADFI